MVGGWAINSVIGPPPELDVRTASLVNAVVHRRRFQFGRFSPEASYVFGCKQVGDEKIAFDLDLADAFSQG